MPRIRRSRQSARAGARGDLNLPEFNQRAVSVHVYSKPFDTCEVYQREKGTYADVPLFYTSEYGKLNPDGKTSFNSNSRRW